MDIYIEDVLVENCLVTYLVLSVVFLFTKDSQNKWRTIFASVLGGTFALIYPILNLSCFLLLIFKLGVGYIISLVAFHTSLFKRQMFFFCMFMVVTAIYGGVSLMVHFAIFGNFTGQEKLPSIAIVFLILVVTYLLKQVESRLNQKSQINSFVYKVKIVNNNTEIVTSAYLDTGNVLCDGNNTPISLINFKLFSKLNNRYKMEDFFKKDLTKLKNGRYLQVKTLTGTDTVLVFCVDSLKIFCGQNTHTIENPSFALSKVKLTSLDCDVVLNSKLIVGV